MKKEKESIRDLTEFCMKIENGEKPALPKDYESYIVSIKKTDEVGGLFSKMGESFSMLAVLISVLTLISTVMEKDTVSNIALLVSIITIMIVVVVYLAWMIRLMISSKKKKNYECNYYFVGNKTASDK